MLETLTNGNPEADLPLAALNTVAKHVSTISARKAPSLIMQKRHFVRGWHQDARNRLGGGGGAGGGKGGGSPMKNGKAQMGAAEIFAEVDARINAVSAPSSHARLLPPPPVVATCGC